MRISQLISSSPSISSLDLVNCKVGCAGVAAIGVALMQNTSLKSLKLVILIVFRCSQIKFEIFELNLRSRENSLFETARAGDILDLKRRFSHLLKSFYHVHAARVIRSTLKKG